MKFQRFIIFIFSLYLCLFFVVSVLFADEYPVKITVIEKNQAMYDTPQNAVFSINSAYLNEDLKWLYETMTEEAVEQDRQLFKKSNLDPKKRFDFVKRIKESFIIDEKPYKDVVLIILEDHYIDGRIVTGPLVLINENGKWKQTNKYANDEALMEYRDFFNPKELKATVRIYPKEWNLNWYEWIEEHYGKKKWITDISNRINILCVITELKDINGKTHEVGDILPETVKLNNRTPSEDWLTKEGRKRGLFMKSAADEYFLNRLGFTEWFKNNVSSEESKKAILFIKFNKRLSITSMPMSPGSNYKVIISGKLENGTSFTGSTVIAATDWGENHGKDRANPEWINSDNDVENWWNSDEELLSLWSFITSRK